MRRRALWMMLLLAVGATGMIAFAGPLSAATSITTPVSRARVATALAWSGSP